MIYGTPQLTVEDDTTDRIGIRTLILSRMWQPSREGLSQSELDAQKPGIPSVPGGVLLIGTQTRRASGSFKSTWTFEGIEGDGKSVTFKDRANTLDYEFEPSFSQVSMLQWNGTGDNQPNALSDLLKNYGGTLSADDQAINWAQTLSSDNTSSAGLGGSQATAGLRNPMYGQQDFFRLEGTYRCRYAALQLPSGLNSGVGLIASGIPGNPPFFSKRNWLKVPPRWSRRGLVYDITEEYWLSGIGGWPEVIYGSTKGDPGGGNLSSGHL